MQNERAVPTLHSRIAVAAITFCLGVVGAALPAGAQSTNLTVSTAADHNIALTPAIHPTGPGANLNVTTLVNAVQAGQVSVLTYGPEGTPDSGEPGNIVINSPIAYTNEDGIELLIGSRGDITVNQPITPSGQTFLTFAPFGSVDVEAALTAGSGDVGFEFTPQNQLTVNAPITTTGGARGIFISAESNDQLTGDVTINKPLTLGPGQASLTIFAEGTVKVTAALTVDQGWASVFANHGPAVVSDGAVLSATALNIRPGPAGEQISVASGGASVTIGGISGSGATVKVKTLNGVLFLQSPVDLDLTNTVITAGGAFIAMAGGDVILDGQISAGGAADQVVQILAGKNFQNNPTGVLQATGGASADIIVDYLNPTRPNLSLQAQLVNSGTLDLGPNGALFAVHPSDVLLGTFVPAHTRFNVWFGEPEAVAGINYKVLDPNGTPAIPTLSTVGLAALVSLLALASLWMLRRQSA
jgi:hypothetical protein